MVLAADTALGISAAQWFKQETDTVIEIGLTPNRADATNHKGVTRDILAWMRHHENPTVQLKRKNTETNIPVASKPSITVTVENIEGCPRYTGIVIKGIEVKDSPEWLQSRLKAIGQRPINNIVDITNYIRADLGQPLHAFDLHKIGKGQVRVKTLPTNTVFKSLDEIDRKLFAEDLMICDGDDQPMCIGGVFGGAHSGVSPSTTEIFLESAFFNPKWIRRSMLRHNLRTDAAWMFEKGVDPNGTKAALMAAADMIVELAGGTLDTQSLVDLYPTPVQPVSIPVSYERLNRLIGETLPKEKVKNILNALEIGVEQETDLGFIAIVPTNKPDVTREADIVEEVLRVHGLDSVPIPTQIRSSMELQPRPNMDSIRNNMSDILAATGFNECMSMSLTNSAYYIGESAALPIPKEHLVFVHNTANQGLDCMRPSMLFSGLESIQRNQNRQNPDLRLFEFGKTYATNPETEQKDKPRFSEGYRLSIWMTGSYSAENWQASNKKQVDFYTLKGHVQNLLARLGITGFQESIFDQVPFQYAIKYHRGPMDLVSFGAVQASVLKKADVKNAVFYAEFNMDNILKAIGSNTVQFEDLNKFPSVRRDLALVLDKSVTFGDIRILALKTIKKTLKQVNLFDVFEDENKLGAGKKSYAVSFIFEDFEKTLQDKEIENFMQQLQNTFEQKLGAVVRS
jgi:phenylalanyl-tRNA synthetase beta chain